MISQLKGTVLAISDTTAVIDVGGVGFSLLAATSTLTALRVGSQATVQTILIVRDDALTLYAFITLAERQLFERLIGVSGVGPKAALSLLSSFASDDLSFAIAEGDANLIATAPGIGKKTAQRLIVELKGAFEQMLSSDSQLAKASSGTSEVAEALLTMGFSAQEATLAVKGFEGDKSDTNALLRHALKRLGS